MNCLICRTAMVLKVAASNMYSCHFCGFHAYLLAHHLPTKPKGQGN